MNTFVAAIIIVVMACCVAVLDYDEVEAAAKEYCDNVKSGIHPDYKDIYKKSCKAEK